MEWPIAAGLVRLALVLSAALLIAAALAGCATSLEPLPDAGFHVGKTRVGVQWGKPSASSLSNPPPPPSEEPEISPSGS
jgi:hypothetical protein